jgi:hypothetical protein
VRSSHGHFVKTSGLRWLSFMVLAPVPWAARVKALPVLTLLAPSERADAKAGRRHKLLTDRARQGMLQLCRWLPGRRIVFVGDAGFAVHTLAHARTRIPAGRATLIRLRLDASLYAPPAERTARTQGRPAQKGPPLPKLSALLADPATRWQRIIVPVWYGRRAEKPLEITSGTALWYRRGTPPRPIRWVLVRDPAGKRAPQAFFSTDTALAPEEIIAIFVRRWQVEVTFSEVRAHLGVETQRQWSDKAIDRTTPALLGLYSLIVLWAEDLLRRGARPYAAAWYRKSAFTFTDAIAAVRRRIWIGDISDTSPNDRNMPKIPPDRLRRMADALCFAA